MAWKARLTSPIHWAGDRVAAHVEYFDDSAPSVVLHTEGFTFDPTLSNANMQALIQARGAEVRIAKTRADVLAAAFPAATTVINIP